MTRARVPFGWIMVHDGDAGGGVPLADPLVVVLGERLGRDVSLTARVPRCYSSGASIQAAT